MFSVRKRLIILSAVIMGFCFSPNADCGLIGDTKFLSRGFYAIDWEYEEQVEVRSEDLCSLWHKGKALWTSEVYRARVLQVDIKKYPPKAKVVVEEGPYSGETAIARFSELDIKDSEWKEASNKVESNNKIQENPRVGIFLNGTLVNKSGEKKAMIQDISVPEGGSIGKIKIDKVYQDSVDIIVNGQKNNIKVGEKCE